MVRDATATPTKTNPPVCNDFTPRSKENVRTMLLKKLGSLRNYSHVSQPRCPLVDSYYPKEKYIFSTYILPVLVKTIPVI